MKISTTVISDLHIGQTVAGPPIRKRYYLLL